MSHFWVIRNMGATLDVKLTPSIPKDDLQIHNGAKMHLSHIASLSKCGLQTASPYARIYENSRFSLNRDKASATTENPCRQDIMLRLGFSLFDSFSVVVVVHCSVVHLKI